MTPTLQQPEAHPPSQEPPEALWVPDALRGFPADELAALGHTPTDDTYAAWIHARRGHGPDWLARHLHVPPEVADLLVRASQQKQAVKATDTPARRVLGVGSAPCRHGNEQQVGAPRR